MAKLSGVVDVKNLIKGSNEVNAIIGGNLADRLYGNAGEDLIYGGSGNDYIYAGNGPNQIYGEAGNDTLVSGSGHDTYTIFSGGGNDVIIDRGGSDTVQAGFLTTDTSGVFIKRGNDLIIAEGTENLTGDADGDGNDAEDLATEIAGIQALGSAAARRAGMRSIVNNLTTSATIRNHFSTGEIEKRYAYGGATVYDQTVSTSLIDYNTGLVYFNQAATNPNIVRGTGAVDIILASANDQTLKGGKGSDYYYIDAKTNVVIEDISGDKDYVIFADNNGDETNNAYTYTKEGNNLRVTFDDGTGLVVASAIVKNFYGRNGNQVERIGSDEDGNLHGGVDYDASSLSAICDKIPALTSATRTLRGTITDDQLTVAAGQNAYGLAGNDEYTVTAGKAIIVDNAGTADFLNADHLATEADGVFIRKGNDLIILDGGDAVSGYADADAAVADLPNLSKLSQRRTVMNNLLKMSDSITVRNFFSTGSIETINALNNTAISLSQEIMPNLVDYTTGLLVSAKGTGKARVNGIGRADYLLASADGQKLYGGAGDDLYAIPGGMTNVEIYDTNGADKIRFTQADLNGADSYDMSRSGNDLVISVTDAGDGDSSVIIKNHFVNDRNKIERIEDFDNGFSTPTGNANIYGSSGNDTIVGNDDAGISYLYGKDGDDNLYGTINTDYLYGEAGNDTINGGSPSSSDNLFGGEGSDVYEILSGSQTDRITEEDATADDTDKVVFKGADFSNASNSIMITSMVASMAFFEIDEGNNITSGFISLGQFAAGSDNIEVLEDGYGNSVNLSTGVVTGTFNAAITIKDISNSADTLLAPDVDTTLTGAGGADILTGGTGNDTILAGDGIDMVDAALGDDWIDGGAGNDPWLSGSAGNDTIIGGLGDDDIRTGADNDVVLYELDSGEAAGNDTIQDFTIGEDVVRFTTSANDTLGFDFRNHIAVRDTGAGLEIGYGWDEAAQDYANTITFAAYDDASVSTANVIEFVTADGTTALTAAEITAILADIAADGDAPGTLAAIHDDIDAGAGGNDGQLLVDSINTAW